MFIKKLNIKLGPTEGISLFHDSRKDSRVLAEACNILIAKTNELVDRVNELTEKANELEKLMRS
jgi:hypothetical protein